jgi:hypothetical protein
MSQPRPLRAARHRSSVHGPPPGAEAGTGYTSPPPSAPLPATTPLNINRVSSPLSSRNIVRNVPVRPDPNIYDPIDEPIRPSARERRRLQGATSNGNSMMFYPSSGTASSDGTSTRDEPVPFFRTDPFGGNPRRAARRSEGTSESQIRTASMRSSGVLGDGAMEVDSDSDSDSGSSLSSVERQIVRQVSTVRRGQAQIVRNPSQRRSVIPDVLLS